MKLREIPLERLNAERFIEEKVKEIASAVGKGIAINALSGGVDSATVTMLAHRALAIAYFNSAFSEIGMG